MKKTISLLIILFFMSYSIGQNANRKHKNDWDELGLKGMVKSLKENKYDLIHKNGDSIIYHFNNKGNITEKYNYKTDGTFITKAIYKYNDKGNMIERNLFEPDGSLAIRFILKYDSSENILEDRGYNPDGSINFQSTSSSYKYDNNGKIIAESMLKSDRKLEWKYNDGKIFEESIYDTSDGRLRLIGKNTWKHDPYGYKIEQKIYAISDGSLMLMHRRSYKYDKNGNEIEINHYDSNGHLDGKQTCNLHYDNSSNWTKKNVFQDGILDSFSERVIEYF